MEMYTENLTNDELQELKKLLKKVNNLFHTEMGKNITERRFNKYLNWFGNEHCLLDREVNDYMMYLMKAGQFGGYENYGEIINMVRYFKNSKK